MASLIFASGNRIVAAFLALHPPLRAPVRESSPHPLRGLCRIKLFGIKPTANPVQKLFMLFVVGLSGVYVGAPPASSGQSQSWPSPTKSFAAAETGVGHR